MTKPGTETYLSALSDLDAAKCKVERARIEMQLACNHQSVYEAPHQACHYLANLAPFRVCMQCGFSESGWGCGYKVLKGLPAVQVSRDEGYSLRIGCTHDNVFDYEQAVRGQQ